MICKDVFKVMKLGSMYSFFTSKHFVLSLLSERLALREGEKPTLHVRLKFLFLWKRCYALLNKSEETFRLSRFASEPSANFQKENFRCFPAHPPALHRKLRAFALSPSPGSKPALRLSFRLSGSLLAPLRGLAFGLGASSSLLRFGLAESPRLYAPSLRLRLVLGTFPRCPRHDECFKTKVL